MPSYFLISESALFSMMVSRFRPHVLLIRVVLRWRWVRSIGGMILTGVNWSTGREILYSVGGRWMNGYGALVEWYWQGKTECSEINLSHWHFVQTKSSTALGWNKDLRGDRPVPNLLTITRPATKTTPLRCHELKLPSRLWLLAYCLI